MGKDRKNMEIAYASARVSSKEQEEKKNSIEEQFKRIRNFAKKQNIKITREFFDGASAFHEGNRVNFERMIELALQERPNYIILDDSSRLARTKSMAIEVKHLLRSHGINILYASEPNVDNNTIAGFWLEGIQELKNEATSREIGFHTFKGMSGNISQRDDETGWCYKNGGKAPYGYKRKILYKGENNKGKPVYKTIWELDEDTSKIIRKIIVDLYTNQEMSYKSIRDYLNNNGIKNSNNNLWSITTIRSMLTRDRLEEYTGTAIWNKSNNKIIGVKYNEKDKWIICENAHPAIITREEMKKAIERKEKTESKPYTYRPSSEYLLTGKNIENNFIFTCGECGGHIVGSSMGKKNNKAYCCSNNRTKGKMACTNNVKIDKDWLEDKILSIIEENYVCDKNIDKSVEFIYKQISGINKEISKKENEIKKQINLMDKEIKNLIDSIKMGLKNSNNSR